MAKISLRAYNREIETLIERGQSEEAIAHCKFILKTYPKHIDTYRLLGKAFLEASAIVKRLIFCSASCQSNPMILFRRLA